MKRFCSTFILLSACFRDPVTAPADTTLSVVASAPSVSLNGTVDLVVDVLDPEGKTVKDGTPITLTCCTPAETTPATLAQGAAAQNDTETGSALGVLEPALTRTVDGKATAQFRAGSRSGVAYIIARSGGARPGLVRIAIGGAAVTRVAIRASRQSITSSTGPVDVSAIVFDDYGNGVPGVTTTFATSAGVLSDTRVITDAQGVAHTRLQTDRSAAVSVAVGALVASTTLQLVEPPSVAMSVAPRAPMAGEVAQFTVEAAAASGSTPVKELVLDFGDDNRMTLPGASGITTIAHTFTNAGTYQITGTVTDALGEHATSTMILSVLPRPAVSVVIEVGGGQLVPTDVPVVFSAVVTPSTEQSRVVRYEWDFGDESTSTTFGRSCAHVFTAAATRNVSVVAVLSDGSKAVAETIVVVKAPQQLPTASE